MRTVVIRNNTTEEKIWLKTFIANEEYIVPVDNGLVFKYSNLEVLLLAISSGDASIGDGSVFFSSVNDQLNHLKGADTTPRDTDGSLILRQKAAKVGWIYHLTAPEFTTSTVGSLYNKNIDGNDLNEAVVKFYDINGDELSTQGSCDTDCVKTVFTFEPTWDYEIIGGTIKTYDDVIENVRVWVVAVPDIPAQYGGSKVMIQGVNLKFIDPNNGIVADGRASKYMTYSAVYHTSKLQAVVKHPAGHKASMMVAFEMYKG